MFQIQVTDDEVCVLLRTITLVPQLCFAESWLWARESIRTKYMPNAQPKVHTFVQSHLQNSTNDLIVWLSITNNKK